MTYFKVFTALLILLGLTIGAAYVNFGPILNPVINLTIAVVKAVLILLFFMHLRYSSKLTMIFAASGFYWLGILIALTLSDYLTRNWIPQPGH